MFQYQAPTPSRSSVVYSGKSSNAAAKGTVEFVSKRLPPINPEILSEVKSALAVEGALDRRKIIADIKSDPALFVQCTRRLHAVTDQSLTRVDPLAALSRLEDDRLRVLFQKPFPSAISRKISEMSGQQALSLKVTIACAKFAEAMSKRSGLSASSTYSNALFRQIGMNIIAWNYPSVYQSALAKHRSQGEDLNTEIERVLGLSPQQLGARLAEEWGLHLAPPDLTGEHAKKYEQVMELAELCGQSQDPKNYPEAEKKLKAREKELSRLISPNDLRAVERSIETNLKRYEKVSRSVAVLQRSETQVNSGSPVFLAEAIVQRNPLLMRAKPEIKALFAEVYKKITPGAVAVESLRMIAEEVVPNIGFQSGCLFLAGADNRELRAALRFGAYPLAAYERFLHESGSCIRASLDTLTPLRMDGFGLDRRIVSFLCASLNHVRHEGVLYLEIDDALRGDPQFQSTLLFQIVRQALKDSIDGA